jgi:ribonuclease E
MLINAQRPEELRIAIVRDTALENFQVDVAESGLTRGNIYRGTIANIQPSLNAAFIDYGAERHGFLAIQDVVPEAYYHTPRGQARIEEVLERGKPIVVQVARDAIGQKGSSLTTSLSLAGRYLVLTPFDDTRGVSRKVEEEETRRKLKALVANLELPEGCGMIVRTNALDQNKTAIGRDLAALLRLWKRVQTAAVTGKGSRLLYSDQDLIVQALRDHLDSSIEEVMVDDEAAFQKAEAYLQAFMPRAKINLVRYEDRLPLFSRFDLEPQIDRIYERRVSLPSGGSIVIDATEALTAIDVNSGRSTRAATQEETAVNTNLEAAAEVARQLRMRDLGGLVVVDFIDMRASRNQRRVEKTVRDAMKADKARSTVGRISPNGLLEINRQRIQQALQLRTHRSCPTCDGTGRLASPEMVTLNLLRRVEARAASGLVQAVRIALHPELADAMQNSRRQEMAALEREFDIHIEVIAAAGMHRPDERIEWTKRERAAAATTAPPKPAAAALKPWDLTLAATGQEPPPPLADEPEDVEAPEDTDPTATTGRPLRPGRRGSRGGRERGGTGRREAGPAAEPRRRGQTARRGSSAGAGGGTATATPDRDRNRDGARQGGRNARPADTMAADPASANTPAAGMAGSGDHPAASRASGTGRAIGASGAGGGAATPEGDEAAEARRGRKRRRGGRKRNKRAGGHQGDAAAAGDAPEGRDAGAATDSAPNHADAGAPPPPAHDVRHDFRSTGGSDGPPSSAALPAVPAEGARPAAQPNTSAAGAGAATSPAASPAPAPAPVGAGHGEPDR